MLLPAVGLGFGLFVSNHHHCHHFCHSHKHLCVWPRGRTFAFWRTTFVIQSKYKTRGYDCNHVTYSSSFEIRIEKKIKLLIFIWLKTLHLEVSYRVMNRRVSCQKALQTVKEPNTFFSISMQSFNKLIIAFSI